jgi:hypothetical protein
MKYFSFTLCFSLLLVCLSHCKHTPILAPKQKEISIRLRWIPAYPNETEEDVLTGFAWGMSLLGAEMPVGSIKKAFISQGNKQYEVNISALGFSETAQKALYKLINHLKKSEEYTQKGSIDLGRFLVLTLHSSWNYYAITNMPKTYAQFTNLYTFDKNKLFPVTNSGVAAGNRLISFPLNSNAAKIAFIAEEGKGELGNGTFQTAEFEVFDVMKNGQLRFGIYNHKTGDLEAASPIVLGSAGKPGKCMWCHESSLQTLHDTTSDLLGANYMSVADFKAKIAKLQGNLTQFQSSLSTDIHWKDYGAHTKQEWLYIGFMEPNLARIAEEWGLSEAEALQKIAFLPTHKHSEFAFFGDCYDRAEIDSLAPYRAVRVPISVREPSSYEPNLVK